MPTGRPKEKTPLLTRTGPAPVERGVKIELDQEEVSPGGIVSGRLILLWRAPRRVRGVRLTARGGERTAITVSTGQSSVTYREADLVLDDTMILFGNPQAGWQENLRTAIATVAGRSTFPILEAGTYQYPFQLQIPGDALPSYKGKHCSVRYEILARVDVPAAIDLTAKAAVAVPPEAVSFPACEPALAQGQDGSLISIEGGSTKPGSRIRGRIRFPKAAPKGPFQLELQAAEWAKAKKFQRKAIRGRVRQDVERSLGDQPFEFSVPDDFPSPFEGCYAWLRWQIAVKLPRRGVRRPILTFQIPIEMI